MNKNVKDVEVWEELIVESMRIGDYFEISNHGRVRKLEKNGEYLYIKIMESKLNGRLYVSIKGTIYFIHRLVADCFVPNPKLYYNVNFKDGDIKNVYYKNLEWSSKQKIKETIRRVNEDNYNAVIKGIDEEWIQIEPNYKLSNFGNVLKKNKSGEWIPCSIVNDLITGEKKVSINCNYKKICRLVAVHFVPNPKLYHFTEFIDGNNLNTYAGNIRWVKNLALHKSSGKGKIFVTDAKNPVEEWVALSWADGYEVSNIGNVRYTNSDGNLEYATTTFNKTSGRYMTYVNGRMYYTNRLVAECFIPNPHNFKYCLFKTKNYKDITPSNLEWSSSVRNNK